MTTKKSVAQYFEERLEQLTFGDIISAWRLADEISQTAYAKKLGLSVQNLNDLEKGRRIPSPARAAKIAKKMGLSEIVLIQVAIRDNLRKEGFKYKVTLEASPSSD